MEQAFANIQPAKRLSRRAGWNRPDGGVAA